MKSAVALAEVAVLHGAQAIDGAPWIEELELKFGCHIPRVYRLFLQSDTFGAFDSGGVTLFSNTGKASPEDITVEPFRDKALAQWLRDHHYIQIGRPNTGSYDPVCIQAAGTREPAVVQLDHEDILLARNKVRQNVRANSFLELLNAHRD